MKKKFLFSLCAFSFFFAANAFSQSTTYHFHVKDDEDEAIAGASIVVKNPTQSKQTDIDGDASFEVTSSAVTADVSFIGFRSGRIVFESMGTTPSPRYYVIILKADEEEQ